MLLKASFLLIFYLCLANAFPSILETAAGDSKCGYESCPAIKNDPGVINVHLVPHTHDDVGWLKTVDQYYYGSQGQIQKASVQYIIDTVVQGLLQDPARKFVYVESAFFSKWWHEQSNALKEQVKMLVNEGRLEFIGGAWSMNDEANTHYQSLVDHFSWGLKFLKDTFGECARPRIGWQIDPFGHSREQASLFTKMGYDGLFFSRLDWRDKTQRKNDKTMEMIWKSSANLDDSDLFTGVLYNHYSPPPGFCYDVLCNDEPIIDDKYSADYNVESRLEAFDNFVRGQAANYRTNNVILTMGDDFHYMSADMWFKNLDKIIKYANEREDSLKLNVFYSTPSCYLKALHEANIEWPPKTEDFFPYANDPYAYWTGYFTSRPSSKRFERIGNQFLQVCKKLSATAKTQESFFDENLGRLREEMGVMQHHDAVTGTEKQHVADDYHRELYRSILGCEENTRSSLNQWTTGQSPPASPSLWELKFDSCLNLNISVCSTSEDSQRFMVTAYNLLGYETSQFIRFPVGGSVYEVRDSEKNVIQSDVVPIPTSLKDLHYRTSTSTNELVFKAENVPAVGFKSFYVTRMGAAPAAVKLLAEATTIGDSDFSISFDTSGMLSQITVDGTTSRLAQNFLMYQGASGNNAIFANRSSGAYIFRPDPSSSETILGTDVTVEVFRRELVDEVHQVFNEWISQVVRIFKTQKVVEFEWLVGPIPVEDDIGKEIISRFYTDIKTDGTFFTDTNGRETLKRVRDFRVDFTVTNEEPIAGNYYPINTKIAIEDENFRLAVLNDRAQGGSSIVDGTVELMVHRRLLHDDAFGVSEALNEQAHGRGLIARGKHWLVFGRQTSSTPTLKGRERLLQNEVLMSNWLFFNDMSATTLDDWATKYTNKHSSIGSTLPPHVYLMTLEPWNEDSLLVRFEHVLEKDEDPDMSKPVTFNLAQVFPGEFDFTEMTLAANQRIEELSRLQFRTIGSRSIDGNLAMKKQALLVDNPVVTLNPMEMRTFIISKRDSNPQPTNAPISSPTNPPPTSSLTTERVTPDGAVQVNVFKLFPIFVLAVLLKNFM